MLPGRCLWRACRSYGARGAAKCMFGWRGATRPPHTDTATRNHCDAGAFHHRECRGCRAAGVMEGDHNYCAVSRALGTTSKAVLGIAGASTEGAVVEEGR